MPPATHTDRVVRDAISRFSLSVHGWVTEAGVGGVEEEEEEWV